MKKFTSANVVDLVGVGGTGSWLYQILDTFQFGDRKPIFILHDFDIVEAKNLIRQNFYEEDIGRFKGSATISKSGTSGNFSFDKKYCKENVSVAADIVIGLVDTIDSRHDILQVIATGNHPVLLIDTGNEDTYGQVMLIYYDGEDFIIPEAYKGLISKIDSEVRQGSCTDYIEQTASINKSNAALTAVIYSRLIDLIHKYNENLTSVSSNSTSVCRRQPVNEYVNYSDVIKQLNINESIYINHKLKFDTLDPHFSEFDNAFEFAFYKTASIFWNSYAVSTDNESELISLSIDEINEINKNRIEANRLAKAVKGKSDERQ